MTSCPSCGALDSAEGDFCGVCGAFLEWDGERTPPPLAPDDPLLQDAAVDADLLASDAGAQDEVGPDAAAGPGRSATPPAVARRGTVPPARGRTAPAGRGAGSSRAAPGSGTARREAAPRRTAAASPAAASPTATSPDAAASGDAAASRRAAAHHDAEPARDADTVAPAAPRARPSVRPRRTAASAAAPDEPEPRSPLDDAAAARAEAERQLRAATRREARAQKAAVTASERQRTARVALTAARRASAATLAVPATGRPAQVRRTKAAKAETEAAAQAARADAALVTARSRAQQAQEDAAAAQAARAAAVATHERLLRVTALVAAPRTVVAAEQVTAPSPRPPAGPAGTRTAAELRRDLREQRAAETGRAQPRIRTAPPPPRRRRDGDTAVLARRPEDLVPQRRRWGRTAADRVDGDGVVCAVCELHNAPGRTFCGRCGSELAPAVEVVAVALPWWRRVLDRVRPPAPAVRPAGYRPGTDARGRPQRPVRAGQVLRRGRGLLANVAILGTVLFALGLVTPPGASLRERAVDALTDAREEAQPTLGPVRALAADASSVLPGRAAVLAVDGVTTTSWAEGAAGPGVGEVLTIRFDRPIDLEQVGIRIGVADPAQYGTQPRPSRLLATLSDGTVSQLRLADTPDFQSTELRGRAVTRVSLRIEEVYAGTTGADAALSEVEFFARQ